MFVGGVVSAGASGAELAEAMKKGLESARPSGWDPILRIADQELDGIDAEVLYPSLAMTLFTMTDAELQRACFSAYNGWVAEFCSHNPQRLYGIGLISLEDVTAAVADLEDISKRGMRGAMIWGSPPEDRPYDDPAYDRFWRAAEEHRLPVSLHVATGRGSHSARIRDALGKWGSRSVNAGVLYMGLIHEIQESLSTLIFGGVFERFPELRIVSAENDVGWFPHYLHRLEHTYEKYREMMPNPPPRKPSEYVRRQIWATFQDDPVGPANHQFFGADNYMWASDFPHSDSTFPESHTWIEYSPKFTAEKARPSEDEVQRLRNTSHSSPALRAVAVASPLCRRTSGSPLASTNASTLVWVDPDSEGWLTP